MNSFFCIILSVAPPARGLFRVPECSTAICSTSNQTHGHVQGSTNRGLYDERPRLGRMIWIFYEQVFEKAVIRVRKGSYNSLMHAIHRGCAKENRPRDMHTLPKRQEKDRLQAQCRFPAHIHPVAFVPFPSHSQDPTAKGHRQ